MKFIFGIHNHQPVGNFDHVIEKAYQRSYLPFLDLAESYSFLRFSMHISGPLVEWLEKNHPGYIDRVADLVVRRNIEILSSGFYEPILASISDADKVGQIKMMNDYIFHRFGKYPEGMWLTERVWEPGLVKPITEAGIKYIAVDDTHFSTSGQPVDQLEGYYLTEDQGCVLGVFPISHKLRYTIPFQPPEETTKIFENHPGSDDSVLVMADDGEKFGVWPGTYDHCYGENRWLDSFFQHLELKQDDVQTTTFSEVFHQRSPKGRIYLPTSSYFEMGEWTLSPELNQKFDIAREKLSGDQDDLKSFVKGGYWRNFLTKYSESNWMLKRVNYTSATLNGCNDHTRQSIWRSQCNCAYWHGVFGGLYLPHLRHAIFENLIIAEKQEKFNPVETIDIDHDGVKEFILSGKQIRLFCSPIGGAIRELDYLPANFNLMNTMSRYVEHYHAKLRHNQKRSGSKTISIHDMVKSKEDGLENLLFYDSHPRWSLLDKFLENEFKIHDLISGSVKDCGTLHNQKFDAKIDDSKLNFYCDGRINGLSASIHKQIYIIKNSINILVEIKNTDFDIINSLYGCEFNFSFLGGHSHDRYYLIDGSKPEIPELDSSGIDTCAEISLVTEWENMRCNLKFEKDTKVWRYPVETINMSESGFEKVYQCSSILPTWDINLRPGEKFKTQITVQVHAATETN